MGFKTQVYVVQRADGTIVGAKLVFGAAKALEKACAPARVISILADKTDAPNAPDETPVRPQVRASRN